MRQLKNGLKVIKKQRELRNMNVTYSLNLLKKGNYFILDWPKRLKNQVKAFPDRRNSETDNKIQLIKINYNL